MESRTKFLQGLGEDGLRRKRIGEWEIRYLESGGGRRALRLLESLSGAEAIQKALKVVQGARFPAGVDYLVSEKGAKLERAAPAKAEPGRAEKKAETRTDKEILWELDAMLKRWNGRCAREERYEFENRILELLEELSDVKFSRVSTKPSSLPHEDGFVMGTVTC